MVIISKMRLLVVATVAASTLQGISSRNSCALTQSLSEETSDESLALLQKRARGFPWWPFHTKKVAPEEKADDGEAGTPPTNLEEASENTEDEGAQADSSEEETAQADNSEGETAQADNSEGETAQADNSEGESAQADNSGEESAQAADSSEESAQADSSGEESAQAADSNGEESAQADSNSEESAQADSNSEESAQADSNGEELAQAEKAEEGSAPAEAQSAEGDAAEAESTEDGAAAAESTDEGAASADNTQSEQASASEASAEDSAEEGQTALDGAEADNNNGNEQYLIRDEAKMVQWSRKQKGMVNKYGLNTTKLETCGHEMAELVAEMKGETSKHDIKKHLGGNHWAIHREMFEFLGQMAEKEFSELDASTPDKVVCETGFRQGTTVVAFTCISGATQVRSYNLRESEENTKAMNLISKKYPKSFVMIKGMSQELLRDSIGVDGWLPCNVAFINGGKTFETVQSDIQNFAKWAAPGGLVMLDGCNIDNENERRGARLAFDKAVHDGLVKEPAYITGVTRYNKTVCFGRFSGQEAASAQEQLTHSSFQDN